MKKATYACCPACKHEWLEYYEGPSLDIMAVACPECDYSIESRGRAPTLYDMGEVRNERGTLNQTGTIVANET